MNMARKQRRTLEKRKTSKLLVVILGLAILLLFAMYFNQSVLVGSAVYVSETPVEGTIDLMKEGSVTFTALPSTSRQITLRTGISATDAAPKNYSFNLNNKGAQLYSYELKSEDNLVAQDVLFTGGTQDSSLIYLNLNDTVADLKVWYAAGKIIVQNTHTTPTAVCGNGIVEGSEQCDGSNLLGKSCQSLGFSGGTLSCTSCSFNTAACVGVSTVPPQPVPVPEPTPTAPVTPTTPPPTTSVVNGTKLSLGVVTPANDTFSTLLTATENFSQTIFVYTVLYDADGKVLKLESDEITGGMTKDQFYVVTVTYPPAEVKKKTVLVFDVEPNLAVPNPTVYGKLEEAYS